MPSSNAGSSHNCNSSTLRLHQRLMIEAITEEKEEVTEHGEARRF
jgi:hypothetical protein